MIKVEKCSFLNCACVSKTRKKLNKVNILEGKRHNIQDFLEILYAMFFSTSIFLVGVFLGFF